MNNEILLLMKNTLILWLRKQKFALKRLWNSKWINKWKLFLISPPINLVEEGKCLLGVTSFEYTNSVFNINNKNNSFSITIPGHRQTDSAEKNIDELNTLLEFRSLELHVKEVRKRGNQIKIGNSEDRLSGFDTQNNEILEELQIVKYNYLDYLV